jgi:hypothetical protein
MFVVSVTAGTVVLAESELPKSMDNGAFAVDAQNAEASIWAAVAEANGAETALTALSCPAILCATLREPVAVLTLATSLYINVSTAVVSGTEYDIEYRLALSVATPEWLLNTIIWPLEFVIKSP